MLACIPLTFYYSFTNAYLNDVGVVNAAGKMTLGQMSEIGMMLLMPLVFRLATVRTILLVGLLSWAVRYVLLGYGDPGPGVWMFYLAIQLNGQSDRISSWERGRVNRLHSPRASRIVELLDRLTTLGV